MESLLTRGKIYICRCAIWKRDSIPSYSLIQARRQYMIHYGQKQERRQNRSLVQWSFIFKLWRQSVSTSAAAIAPCSVPFPVTMASWQMHTYGGLEELQLTYSAKIPPITNPTDVLVEIRAASVNPIDVLMSEGYGSSVINFMRQIDRGCAYSLEFPLVLGRDFSGIVVECGHQVKDLEVGDEVWGAVGVQRQGTHAQYAVVSANSLALKPAALTHTYAASIPYVALTAYSALKVTGELTEESAKNKEVLVLGGSGGVGTFAVQLLKSWGAQVTSTCSTEAVPLLESLGVDTVIDYTQPDAEKTLQLLGGFDIVLDASGQQTMKEWISLKPWSCSKYITLSSPTLYNIDLSGFVWGMMRNVQDLVLPNVTAMLQGASCRWAYFMPNGHALNQVAKMVDRGQIQPVVEKVFPFTDASEAYRKVKAGHARGKIVINNNGY